MDTVKRFAAVVVLGGVLVAAPVASATADDLGQLNSTTVTAQNDDNDDSSGNWGLLGLLGLLGLAGLAGRKRSPGVADRNAAGR